MNAKSDDSREVSLFLRAIAIVLITNSHMDALYPVAMLSTGGALGDSLFFMLSGFGLARGVFHKGLSPFFSWVYRRVSRIYPSIWIAVFLLAIVFEGQWQTWLPLNYLSELIYPTTYWFISALLLFYLLLYPLLKQANPRSFLVVIGLLFIPYFIFYFTMVDLTVFSVDGGGYFKWIYFFQIMLFGSWLAFSYEVLPAPSQKNFLGLIFTVLIYFVLKLFIHFGYFLEWQCLVQFLIFPFVYFALVMARHSLLRTLMKNKLVNFVVWLLGTCTLEIYLVQHHLYRLDFIASLLFPLNIFVFALICLPVAYGVYWLSIPLQKWVGRSAS